MKTSWKKSLRMPLILAILCLFVPFAGIQIYKIYKSRQHRIYDRALKKPVVHTKLEIETGKPFTNSIGMTFVYIPAGRFVMGSPDDEIGRDEFEYQHEVIISKGFYLQMTEVTQQQWTAVMELNPSKIIGDDHPVEQVSWYDCQQFIKRLNQMEGDTKYRLPTEAEWEYACRAGMTTAFYSGHISVIGKELDPNLDRLGWYRGNSQNTSHPAGQKLPNVWGLYDMHGNVWEWCQDWWEHWYGKFQDGPISDPKGPRKGVFKVYRGGSWFSGAQYHRAADRMRARPDTRSYGIGFRVARSEYAY
jgi:formylglycine-generating enzyme required for sulfatase activity